MARTGKIKNRRTGALLLLIFFGLGLACLGLTTPARCDVKQGWVRTYDESNADWSVGLALDQQGNVYVSGTSQ